MDDTLTATPPATPPDPLLLGARILVWIFLAGVGLAFFFQLIGTVTSLPLADRDEWRSASGQALTLVALGTIAGMAWRVLAIIDSVAKEEVFDRRNADRIEALAHGLLGLQVIAFAAMIMRWPIGGDINGFDVTLRPGLGAIAIVLLLFILARVFRKGAELDADLAGTV